MPAQSFPIGLRNFDIHDVVVKNCSMANLLGIDNLQARLYAGSSVGIGNPPGGSIVEAWGTSFDTGGATVTNVVLAPINLPGAGTYTLNLRGTVLDGGGSYAGVLTWHRSRKFRHGWRC